MSQVGVGGRQTCVTEQCLDDVDGRSFGRKFRRERVAKGMRVDSSLDPGPSGKTGQHTTHVGGFQSLAAKRTEYCRSAANFEAFTTVEPSLQDSPCTWIKCDGANGPALPIHDSDSAGVRIEVSGHNRKCLAYSQAAAIQRRNQCCISDAR